jgi:hypothetical protein|tara:strand:+ start:2098 stop:2310 length:213 start_codon:yes stop_codon:yes gene_type:complete
MKLPEYMNKESSHVTNSLNTMTLTGISLLWGTMLGLLNPWWTIGTVLFLTAGYGSEINKRKESEEISVRL